MKIRTEKHYHDNGQLRYECSYKEDGSGHGIQKFWHENRSMNNQYSIRNGNFHGPQIRFRYGN